MESNFTLVLQSKDCKVVQSSKRHVDRLWILYVYSASQI